MINSPSWFVGIIFLWLMLTVIGNIIEKQDILTSTQMAQIRTETQAETVTTKDPNTGAASTFGNVNYGIVEALWKSLTCDYSWLYKINADGTKTPNDWYWIWVILYYGISAGIVIGLILTIRYKT